MQLALVLNFFLAWESLETDTIGLSVDILHILESLENMELEFYFFFYFVFFFYAFYDHHRRRHHQKDQNMLQSVFIEIKAYKRWQIFGKLFHFVFTWYRINVKKTSATANIQNKRIINSVQLNGENHTSVNRFKFHSF